MRRKDRLLSNDAALDILKRGEYGILSMVLPEGEPYAIPLNYCLVEGTIYFHAATSGTKLMAIQKTPQVSFCVVGYSEIVPEAFSAKYSSCVVVGIAEEINGSEKQKALEGLVEKYSPAYCAEGVEYIDKWYDRTSVVRIVPERITAKGNL